MTDALAKDCGIGVPRLRDILYRNGEMPIEIADQIICGLDMPHLWFENEELREIYDAA